MEKNLYFGILLALLPAWTNIKAADASKRFTLLEDKLNTHRLIFPKNSIFDLQGHTTKNIGHFLEKVRSIGDKESPEKQLAHAQEVLQKFNKTEHAIDAEIRLNIPLPRFRIQRLRLLPRLEIDTGVGGLVGVQQRKLYRQEILEYVGNDVPASIQDLLANCSTPLSPGDNIIEECTNGVIRGFPYRYPNDQVPQVFLYGKIESRLGPKFYYIYRRRFKGDLKIYWRGRSDVKIRIGDTALQNNRKIAEMPRSIHHSNLSLDYRFRYQWKKLSGFLAVEEVRLMEIDHKEGLSPPLHHAPPPLWRGHLLYRYRPFPFLRLRSYLGLHYRKEQKLSEGAYLGILFIFKRLHIENHLDPEYLTWSTSLNLPRLSLAGWIKTPIQEQKDTVKPSSLLGLSLSIFL